MARSLIATNGSLVFLGNMGVVDECSFWLTLAKLNTSYCEITNTDSVPLCAQMKANLKLQGINWYGILNMSYFYDPKHE